MRSIIPVAGHIGGECFLLVSERSAVLLDAGFAFCADRTAANIRAVLGDRPLDAILASHSHYDHVSGAAVIRRAYPMARVVGSHHAKTVLENPKALDLMRALNTEYAQDAGLTMPEDALDGLAVDVALADGEELRLPDMTVRALATPGHTRCAMSYFLPEQDLLVCSETQGITPRYPEVIPCMIVGYRSTLDSIGKSRLAGARRVFVAHYGVIPEGDEKAFFIAAKDAVEKAVGMLLAMHDAGRSAEEIIAAFYRGYYLPTAAIQPERAFMMNTEALIPRILRETGRTP